MKIIRSKAAMRAWALAQYRKGKTIALVPTMGYLHEGHLALVRTAGKAADLTVVSIYVNPSQFGPREDFSKYPRNLKRDLQLLRKTGAHLVFAPVTMYEKNPAMTVVPGPMADVLCGRFRTGHFAGVCTIVLKFFNLIQPDAAIFGQKDAQQFALLCRMVKEFDLPIKMIAHPIIREKDGLAKSSRNVLLSKAERALAPSLYAALKFVKASFRKGRRNAASVLKAAAGIPKGRLQYLSAVDPSTLTPIPTLRRGTLVAGAMFAGKTRLIDNLIL